MARSGWPWRRWPPLTPDGQWRWDGAQWVPAGQATAQTPAGAFRCSVCGAQPAAEVVMHTHTGMILWGIRRSFRQVLRRDCGLALFRQKQNRTLLTGGWGWISFGLWNPIAILSNIVSRGEVMKLPASDRRAGAAAMDPGRPIYLRPGMILSCDLGLVILA